MSGKQREGTLEKNRLADFDLRELIFVDANIFIDHASANPSYGKSCEEFLEKVESKNIVAITTTGVLDEVGYILSLLEGAKALKNIATRDSDFERATDIVIWSP